MPSSLVPDISAGLRGFEFGQNIRRTRESDQRQQQDRQIQLQSIQAGNIASESNAMLQFDSPELLRANLIRRAQEVTQNPVEGLRAEDFIDMANRLGDENGFAKIQAELRADLARSQEIGAGAKGASARAFAPVVDPSTGRLGVPTFDPATGLAGFQNIEGAPIQQTPEQKRLANIQTKQAESDISVKATEKKEIIKQRVARTSSIKRELSERNRNAARSSRSLRQALVLAQQASQGLKGSAKLKLSRLVPGIDATDEAALDATLKQLALEQLQQFKGPTTDFEFGVTQAIAGSLGESKESNIARIKSLDRARFFNEREFEQFDRHIKDGGDPDNFRFNFQEVVKTKKGPFTLQDIQDTAVQNNLTIEETIKRLNS